MVEVIKSANAQAARQAARQDFMSRMAGMGYDLGEFNPDKWWPDTQPVKEELSGGENEKTY